MSPWLVSPFPPIITIPTSLYRRGNGDDRSVGASDGSEKGATLIL